MPPQGFYPVPDDGEFLFQVFEQHSGLQCTAGDFQVTDYTIEEQDNQNQKDAPAAFCYQVNIR